MTTSDNQCVRRIQTESEGDRRKCDLTRGSSEEDWLLSVRRHGRWWCPLQGRRGRAPSKQAHRRQPPPSLDWQRLVGPPTSPPTPPLPTCCLSITSMLSHQGHERPGGESKTDSFFSRRRRRGHPDLPAFLAGKVGLPLLGVPTLSGQH